MTGCKSLSDAASFHCGNSSKTRTIFFAAQYFDLTREFFARTPGISTDSAHHARHYPGGDLMENKFDRRSFLRIAGTSLSIGALYSVFAPLARGAGQEVLTRTMAELNGEAPSPFSFIQLSDTHVGFNGPPDPLGTRAFESAVASINALKRRPELVIITGDLTHDADTPDEHAKRYKLFKQIAGRINGAQIKVVPGENDAALDGGDMFRQFMGPTHYSFDHRGVHFIALDNVSSGRPAVGAEQLAWMKSDLARFPKTAPIVVFTHRPLFDLRPDWEWFTSDGDDVMNALAPYDNVTVLYGHIHRENFHQQGSARMYAARSLIFAFPDPATPGGRKPVPFDKAQPFKDLGMRAVKGKAHGRDLRIEEIELTMNEYSGTVGMDQMLKHGKADSVEE
jgi:predicted phosphodiesterase